MRARASMTIAAALFLGLLAGCGENRLPDGRTQLEATAGVPPELAGQLSTTDLALIVHLRGRSELNRHERERRIERVLSGASPITFGNF